MLDTYLPGVVSNPGDRRDMYRATFFAGSYFYSIRPVPGLAPGAELYRGPDGAVRVVGRTQRFTAPRELAEAAPPLELGCVEGARGSHVAVDPHRCSDCNRTFADTDDLLRHCSDSGHRPVVADPGGPDPGGYETRPAALDELVAYANCVLHAALASDPEIKRWGRDYVDLKSEMSAKDWKGRLLGIDIYRAYTPTFSAIAMRRQQGDSEVGAFEIDRSGSGGGKRQATAGGGLEGGGGTSDAPGPFRAQLVLTVDLRAKIIRTKTLLELLYGSRRTNSLSPSEQEQAKREWEGAVIIHRNEKRCTLRALPGVSSSFFDVVVPVSDCA
jgi:predicted  nucleic acid-binding Zn-ribbon protein